MAKVTIEDVAERAGLSVATVDRVINARSSVRPKNQNRVEAAVRALNYQPDKLAVRLARKRHYRFCFVLPRGDNLFMRNLEAEISAHARHLEAERVQTDILYTDVFDADALTASLDQINGIYDGIAVVALDHPRVRDAINRLMAVGAKLVTLVSDVPGSERRHFVGIENAAAGRTAATLLGRYLGGRSGKVAVIAGALALRDHAERHFGFAQVMGSEYGHLQQLPVAEGRDNAERSAAVAASLVDTHPDLIGLYVAGAGTTGIIDVLKAKGRARDIVVIAHELNGPTRAALLDGTIDAVISQDAGHEARSAMRVLMAMCDKAPIIAAQERISVDIFVKDNLP